ncbi:MAG TPA: cellulose biosynthesis cyclic di-GMP-binding regulatory protein BcsB, partial [Acetobacteraceae bacterium]|nr:cellulose biosynthesis cyclic di-GMP-binding regulatory protein BcsB [Acetobacteraceae bacterium]
TAKGGVLEHGYLDLRVVWPSLVLLCLLLTGFSFGLWGIATTSGLQFQAYLLNTIWCALCLVPVLASIAVGREREQRRARARAQARIDADIVFPGGAMVAVQSRDLSLSGARVKLEGSLTDARAGEVVLAFKSCGERLEVPATLLHWEGEEAFLQFQADDLATELAVARMFFGRPDAWLHWDEWPADRPLRSLAVLVRCTFAAVLSSYRFGVGKPVPARGAAAPAPARVSSVVRPSYAATLRKAALTTTASLLVLLLASTASAQTIINTGLNLSGVGATASMPAPVIIPPALSPSAPPQDEGEQVQYTLRELGVRGPMQLRGMSDLQGLLFGLRANEVVTSARLTVTGAVSPAMMQSLSQIAVTLNDQAVATISVDPARPNFGPIEINLDPMFFTEINRLNFRFSGRYALECNDPLSGLVWANISDLSTLTLKVARLPQTRDLAHLPEPFFDRRITHRKLVLPFVLPEALGSAGMRAAAVAASWFAVQADYRGASFPVSHAVPAKGDAIVLAVNGTGPAGVSVPRLDGPGLTVLPNPADPSGQLLVLSGRSETELVAAALALAVSHGGFSGEQTLVQSPQLPKREPYVGPHWLPPDRPVPIGQLVDRSELQAFGYTPATIRVPVRTAPDLYTWRNAGLPVDIRYRSPPGPVIDIAASRLDVSVSDTFLRSLTLADGQGSILDWALRQVGLRGERMSGKVYIPPYLLLGRDELQMRFDMRPLARGECAAAPGDIRASIDPDSTVDISRAWRYARMPNLGFFASSGFPFTRLADLSTTAAVLPERPTTVEVGAFLDLIGFLSAITGAPATGLQVVTAALLNTVSDRDLLAVGALADQPALATLLRDGPLRVASRRLTLVLPDAFQDIRALFLGAPASAERTRASLALDGAGEGLGFIFGVESALASGRSVVGVTGMTPAAVATAVATLLEPGAGARVQGDLTLVQAGQVAAFRTSSGYDVGNLPVWMWPQRWLSDRPERASLLMLAAGALLVPTLYWMLRRRAAMRLRARTPKD